MYYHLLIPLADIKLHCSINVTPYASVVWLGSFTAVMRGSMHS